MVLEKIHKENDIKKISVPRNLLCLQMRSDSF